MREPYRTLLGPYRDHWLLGQYLYGDIDPDWAGLFAEPRIDGLSTGEKVVLDFASAWRNLFDLGYVDDSTKTRARDGLLTALLGLGDL